MTPETIIALAEADSVQVILTADGIAMARGPSEALNRWLPTLREHKPGIVTALQSGWGIIRGYDGGYSRDDAELLAAWEMTRALWARLARECPARDVHDRPPWPGPWVPEHRHDDPGAAYAALIRGNEQDEPEPQGLTTMDSTKRGDVEMTTETPETLPPHEAGPAMEREFSAWLMDLYAALVANPDRYEEILRANSHARAYWSAGEKLWRVNDESGRGGRIESLQPFKARPRA